jgi:hypothetical protein
MAHTYPGEGFTDRAVSELGSADIVVANAGIARREPLPEPVWFRHRSDVRLDRRASQDF